MIADFLDNYRPGGPFVLTAIVPDGKTETRTFTDSKEAEAWALRQNETKNIYFHVNRTRGPLTAKAKKEDIAAVEYLHVDIDPRTGEDFEQERARILRLLTTDLPKGIPAPSLVIDSGGGFQAFWRLAEPLNINGDLDKAREAERYNRALEIAFGADSCHDVSRIMRLPGTMNWPTKKKRDKGREPREAEVYSRTDASYPLTAFKPAPAVASTLPRAATGKARAPVPLGEGMGMGTEELLAWAKANGKTLKESTLARIATGEDPLDPDKYPSRSEALFAVCCDLVRAGADDAVIFAVITDPNNKISESVREKPRWQAYAADQIRKARAKVAEAAQLPTWDRVNKDGQPLASYWNARTALLLMGVECRYDKFRDRHLVGSHELQEFAGEFSDHAERILRDEIIRRFGFDPGDMNTHKAVLSLCTENRFDSLIDHLQALPEWDGKPRLDSWLIDFCGAEDSPYTRAAGAVWLTAAIARAFEPGVKFDHMLVLVGGQGVGKSTALRILAGDEFFSDAAFLGARDAREVLEVTSGVWILECAELDGMSKKDVSALKAMIARQADTGRPAYARSPVTVPRRFVLAGTTNEERFLQDPTENRRFWPIAVSRVDLAGLRAARDQLIAEALARYRSGNYVLTLEGEAAAGAKRAQAERRVVDEGYMECLEGLREEIQQWKGQWIVKTEAVYNRLGIPKKDRNGGVPRKVKEAMKALGWKPEGPVRIDGELCRIYVWAGDGNPAGLAPF